MDTGGRDIWANNTQVVSMQRRKGCCRILSPSGGFPAWWVTAWGKIIATTGSLANTVGANQPFRYRGYVYDEETGWYYLQSRYYDK